MPYEDIGTVVGARMHRLIVEEIPRLESKRMSSVYSDASHRNVP